MKLFQTGGVEAGCVPRGSCAGGQVPFPQTRCAKAIQILALTSGAAALAAAAATAHGAEWKPIARLNLGVVITDNVRLGGVGGAGGGGSDVILTTSPTIGLRGQGRRLTLSALYSPVVRGFINESAPETLVNNLNATARLEAVENFMFVDARASIVQTEVSPFGGSTNDAALINVNRVESRTLGLSPYIQGRFPGGGQYQVRHNFQYSTFSTGAFSDSTSNTTTARAQTAPGTLVVPSVEYSHSTRDFASTRVATSDIARLRATFGLSPVFSPYVHAGYEDNEYRLSKISGPVYGGGFSWRPTERTRVSANIEKRFFGTSYQIDANHRWSRASFGLRASKAEQILPGLGGSNLAVSTRDLLDQTLLASIPDAVAREAEVDRLMLQGGLPENTSLSSGLLTTRITLVETINPNLVLTGRRDTLSIGYTWSRLESLSDAVATGITDPFTNAGVIFRRGFSISESHKLTQQITVVGAYSHTITTSPPTTGQQAGVEASQDSYRLTTSYALTPRTRLSGGIRYQRFTSNQANDFQEKAVLADLTHTFY
ncbi:MAG: TIGR03016 family PEP-CTERM system-associated outer membrane protein [Betaproteobacteria bacterium]|nr:TIGR03016 family PEP-CTERM system-associated outer membrane protein [Betaproteobacteria bacterium]